MLMRSKIAAAFFASILTGVAHSAVTAAPSAPSPFENPARSSLHALDAAVVIDCDVRQSGAADGTAGSFLAGAKGAASCGSPLPGSFRAGLSDPAAGRF